MDKFKEWFKALMNPTTAKITLEAIKAVGAVPFQAAVDACTRGMSHEEALAFNKDCANLAQNVSNRIGQSGQDKKDWQQVYWNLHPDYGFDNSGRVARR